MTSTLLMVAVIAQATTGIPQEFAFVVRDAETALPIPFVNVRVTRDGPGPPFRLAGDAGGRVTLSVPVGERITLVLSAIGYDSWTFNIEADGAGGVADIWLPPRPVELEGVSATVERAERSLELAGYYGRRRRGVGRFLGPGDLDDVQASRVSDYFRRLPGVRVAQGEPIFTRGGSGFDGECWPRLVLDGIIVRDAQLTHIAVDDVVPVGDIAAIEAYPSGVGAPPEFSGTQAACGIILIWSKR